MGVSINGGTPLSLDGFCSGKSQSKIWMITRGTPMTMENPKCGHRPQPGEAVDLTTELAGSEVPGFHCSSGMRCWNWVPTVPTDLDIEVLLLFRHNVWKRLVSTRVLLRIEFLRRFFGILIWVLTPKKSNLKQRG